MMKDVKIDIRIMASPKRRSHVLSMLEELGLDESVVSYDDRPNGGSPMYTAKKAWLSPVPEGVTHRIVLQDDVEMVNDFVNILHRAVSNFPYSIWSLYEGQSVKYEDRAWNSPYIRIKGCCCYGVALLMPVEFIVPCFDWAEEMLGSDYKHDDCAIGLYALINGLTVFSTIPSLVQHLAPTNSLMKGHNRESKVSAVYEGKNISGKYDWDNRAYAVSKTLTNDTWLPKDDPVNVRIRETLKAMKRI